MSDIVCNYLKVIGILVLLLIFTIRIYKDKTSKNTYIFQWGIIPLIKYYKEKRQEKNK